MEIDRGGLAAFLRHRRELLQPEDVGLPRGQRRRTGGLRREEVAVLCHMSTDYYARLERERGPQPSEQMIASIAQGLHLSLEERDHLFRLSGHTPPVRGTTGEHINPGLLRILDRLDDTPAEIVTELGETLRQSPLGVALTGDTTRHTGLARSIGYRWFTDPATRALYVADDHDFLSRMFASGLRELATLRGAGFPRGTLRRAAPRPERGVPPPLGPARGRHPPARGQALHPPRGGRPGAELPAAAGPGPVAQPARVHGRAGQRELRAAAAAVGHRVTGDDLTRPEPPWAG